MDNFKHTQMITYFYLKNLRELLDFAYEGRNKTQEEYDQKKKIFEQAIAEKGILENFVFKSNPDKVDMLKEKYEDFMYDVFNDRVITFENGKMIFDVAQKLNYFKSIFEIRGLFMTIALSQVNFAKGNTNQEYDNSVEQLLIDDDFFFRNLFLLLVETAIKENFLEYIKVMNEAKGQPSPQTNFISNILGQYLQLANATVSGNLLGESEDFDNARHRYQTLVDAITGKLGKKTIQDQENYFILAREAVDKALLNAEAKWMEKYNPLVKETVEFEKAQRQN